MDTHIKTVLKIISHYIDSPVLRSSFINAEFNLLRKRFNDDTIYIGLIGSSVGKSSLINSIIGREILPVGIVSGNTRFPCVIKTAETNNINIVYKNGTSRDSEYPIFSDEEIKYIELSLVDINLPDDIALIDTPCICSENEYDEASLFAANILSTSVALAMNYDKPMPRDIADFICEHEMISRMNDSVFIITKADLFKDMSKELPEQISHIEQRVSSVFGVKMPLVIPFSALSTPAMRKMNRENTARMFDFMRSRRKELKASHIYRICSYLREELISTLKFYEHSERSFSSVPASYEFREWAEKEVKKFCAGLDINDNNAYDFMNHISRLANEKSSEISERYHNIYGFKGVKGTMGKIDLTESLRPHGNIIRALEDKMNRCISMMIETDKNILAETDNENRRRFWTDSYVKRDILSCIDELEKVIRH